MRVWLEDKKHGTFHDMTEGASYQEEMNEEDETNRFVLHFGRVTDVGTPAADLFEDELYNIWNVGAFENQVTIEKQLNLGSFYRGGMISEE